MLGEKVITMQTVESIISAVNDYTHSVVKEQAQLLDETVTFPKQEFLSLANMGIFKLELEKEHGGTGQHLSHLLKALEIISTEGATLASIIMTQANFAIEPVRSIGTEKQVNKWLHQLVSGELIGALGQTERIGGARVQEMETKAIKRGNSWFLSGSKNYVSNASVADFIIVVAKINDTTDLNRDSHHYGMFVISPQDSGVSVGKPIDKMGVNGLPVSQVDLVDVKVNDSHWLGKRFVSEEEIYEVMNRNRLMIAAQGIGIAKGVFEKTLSYAKLDRQFGKRLIDSQNTQFKLADIYTEISATESLLKSIKDLEDPVSISMVKLKASAIAIEAAETAIQLTGGYGYNKNNGLERYLRDAKITAIYGGREATQKEMIARQWLL